MSSSGSFGTEEEEEEEKKDECLPATQQLTLDYFRLKVIDKIRRELCDGERMLVGYTWLY